MKNRTLVRWVAALAVCALAPAATRAAVRYVDANSASPTPPYTNWATAATDIQVAVDAAAAGDTVVVTNGVYAVGKREAFDSNGNSLGTNRVVITNAIGLLSANGPQFTIIDGGGAVRCICLADGASLTGFTLTNGAAGDGGGAWCASTNAFLTNCAIVGNSGDWGGGAYRGTLINCRLTGNWASQQGGGAYLGTLINCTLTGNSATGTYGMGGGAAGCTLNNCTLTGNSAGWSGGGASGYGGFWWAPCVLNNCIVFLSPQQNLWVNSPGSGSRPNV